MTCKDCIHLQQNTCDHYGIEVDADAYRICAEMVSKDGTYHNGTDHCPKCGKPVSEWGLCDECDSFELSADYGYDNARFNAYCKSYDDAIKQIWESVSK